MSTTRRVTRRVTRGARMVLMGAVSLGTWTLAAPLGSQAPEPEARDRYEAVPQTVGLTARTDGTDDRVRQPESPEDRVRRARVVARVEGVAITVGELEDLLTVGATEDDVRSALDASIRRVRLTNEAQRRGLFAHPEVVAAERRALVDVLLTRDFGALDHVGGVPTAEVDGLVARLRAEHVTNVELEPLYPLRLDPRPRSVRGEATGSIAPSATTRGATTRGATTRGAATRGAQWNPPTAPSVVEEDVTSEELVFRGDAPTEDAP